ncbi:MAG: BON domain-containing protein [Solirubrobacterales bacterium]|nr:BON domain-containing protein [Solirubrobacterales bacterium]MBV9534173.1 BON domain-containing protein [Solirubrobacterales bacterium]
MNANKIARASGGIVGGTVRIGARLGRRAATGTWGLIEEARHLRQKRKRDMDDVTLAHKVESQIFRGRSTLKSTVNVNVVDGVVWLRGEVKRPEQIRSLEQKASSVPEVRGVENLLHLVKTPAPTRADTPRRQQRTRSSTRRPAPRRRAAGPVSEDRGEAAAPQAEPSPAEHASAGEGRTPAPLGSSGEDEQAGVTHTGEQTARTGNGGAANTGSQEAVPSVGTPAPGESESGTAQ